MMTLNLKELKHYITSRYPFLLIDQASEVYPGVSAKGCKMLTANEWFFPVHFPEEPMMPGMLQMEALLQVLSLTVLTVEGNEGKVVRGLSASKIKLKKRVVPGNCLDIEAELYSYENSIAKGSAKGYVNGEEVCFGEFVFSVVSGEEK